MGIYKEMKILLVFFFALKIQVFTTAEIITGKDGPEVTISNGVLVGNWNETRKTEFNPSRNFSAFEGIPYATAARFASPEPQGNWEGKRYATSVGNVCPQIDSVTNIIYDEEDCLFLNVYAPQTDPPSKGLPVMVWIHGGGFTLGAGSVFGGQYMLEQNVILVTVNHRLGALGFMSTGDSIVGGNMGLKDLIMALKWVKTNIEAFGGDPGSVTIFGVSSGAAAVHDLVISPVAKGLFHKAISHSVTALCTLCLVTNPLEVATKLSNQLVCPVTNSSQMVECLKKKSVKEILTAQILAGNFGPTVDAQASDFSVLPDLPINLIKNPLKNSSSEVPYIIGWNEREGLMVAAPVMLTPGTIDSLNKDWNEQIANLVGYKSIVAHDDLARVSGEVRELYLKNTTTITLDNMSDMADLFTDVYIKDIRKAALLHSAYNKKVYTYQLTHRGNFSLIEHFIKEDLDEGPTHGDELQYLFPSIYTLDIQNWPELIEDSDDEKFSTNLVQLWVSFARDGVPKATGWKSQWNPLSDVKNASDVGTIMNIYNLKMEAEMEKEDAEFVKRMVFWEKVFTASSADALLGTKISLLCFFTILFSLVV